MQDVTFEHEFILSMRLVPVTAACFRDCCLVFYFY